MEIRREDALLSDADAATKKMLALWHHLCRAVLGGDREVGIAGRREYGPTKDYKGALNTAVPMNVDGAPMLVLLLDDPASIQDVLITHELGHWALELVGFKGVRNPSEPHSSAEIMLNSMSQHPALYALQRSLGHDPQTEIDKRARHNLSRMTPASLGLSPSKMAPSKMATLKKGQAAEIGVDKVLLYADDILNCSEELADEMSVELARQLPKAAQCVRDICEIRQASDPAELGSHPAFVQAVMRRLDFGPAWITLDEIPGLKVPNGGPNLPPTLA